VRILLIGGGKVGSYLAREFVTDGHVVSVIEESVERARTVIEESGALVFEGDGTDVELLRSADVDRTDWVLAVTGRDEDNLVACELAATLGAKHVLARLNNPRNRPAFDALKIPVIGVTDLMAGVISHEVEVSDLSRVALMGGGKISLVERSIPEGFPETPLSDLKLPRPLVLVTVIRDGEAFVPGASTSLRPGDRVIAVTTLENEGPFSEAIDAVVAGDA